MYVVEISPALSSFMHVGEFLANVRVRSPGDLLTQACKESILQTTETDVDFMHLDISQN